MLKRYNVLRGIKVAGVPYEPGDSVEVPEGIGNYLTQYGKVELIGDAPAVDAAVTPGNIELHPMPDVADNNRKVAILAAARAAIDDGDTTKAGKPEVSSIEARLGYDITAAERDEAYDAMIESERG